MGVKAGDWIKLDYTVSGAPSGSNLPTWIRLDFKTVEGTMATAKMTLHMADGTEQTSTVSLDISGKGGAALPVLLGGVIPANSEVGDGFSFTGMGSFTLEGETTRTYAGASRTVLYTHVSMLGTDLTYYWDRQTGVMVETSGTSGGMNVKAVGSETNMWAASGGGGIPEFPVQLGFTLLAAAVIVTSYVLARRVTIPRL